jgi:hypothetical protein
MTAHTPKPQDPAASRPTIAFLGIGLMGRPMCQRLLAAGHTLALWNRTPAKAEALRGERAVVHATVADAVAGAQIVISMLEAGDVVAQVIDAAGARLAPGTLWMPGAAARLWMRRCQAAWLAPRPARWRSWRAARLTITPAPKPCWLRWGGPRWLDLWAAARLQSCVTS